MDKRESIYLAFTGLEGLKRGILPFLAIVLTLLCLALSRLDENWLWGLVVSVPVLALSVYDLYQKDYAVLRNYPVAGWARYFFKVLRPFLRSYIVESDLEGRPFNHDQRQLVYERSRDLVSSHPFGTELDVYASEFRWITHSIDRQSRKAMIRAFQ
jgi:hypothetical protein